MNIKELQQTPTVETNRTSKDSINPAHYQQGERQLWDIMKELVSPEEYAGYLKLNVCKYLYRYKNKNGKEDLLKCQKYLEKLMETEYGS